MSKNVVLKLSIICLWKQVSPTVRTNVSEPEAEETESFSCPLEIFVKQKQENTGMYEKPID